MHDIAFDAIHDEIVVTSPLAQGILTFRGAANGEEAPIRYIQGDKTQIKGVGATGKVSIDAVHNEIYWPLRIKPFWFLTGWTREMLRRRGFSAVLTPSWNSASRTLTRREPTERMEVATLPRFASIQYTIF